MVHGNALAPTGRLTRGSSVDWAVYPCSPAEKGRLSTRYAKEEGRSSDRPHLTVSRLLGSISGLSLPSSTTAEALAAVSDSNTDSMLKRDDLPLPIMIAEPLLGRPAQPRAFRCERDAGWRTPFRQDIPIIRALWVQSPDYDA